mmetsp:Transcript_24772/g.58431  ORF Transcript_24772/g.58431 Transcript_24772/m.58431 type:complete len:281 (-) Transcript_24772:198-1040(-)
MPTTSRSVASRPGMTGGMAVLLRGCLVSICCSTTGSEMSARPWLSSSFAASENLPLERRATAALISRSGSAGRDRRVWRCCDSFAQSLDHSATRLPKSPRSHRSNREASSLAVARRPCCPPRAAGCLRSKIEGRTNSIFSARTSSISLSGPEWRRALMTRTLAAAHDSWKSRGMESSCRDVFPACPAASAMVRWSRAEKLRAAGSAVDLVGKGMLGRSTSSLDCGACRWRRRGGGGSPRPSGGVLPPRPPPRPVLPLPRPWLWHLPRALPGGGVGGCGGA